MRKHQQTICIALILTMGFLQQSPSLAQTKVVVVPLGGEAAKPTIYTEVQLQCGRRDDVGTEYTFIGDPINLQKVREKSTIIASWNGGVNFTNITSGTAYTQTEIRVNDSVPANFQTTSVVTQEAIDNQTSIEAVFTELPAGPFTLGFYVRTNDSSPANLVNVGAPCFSPPIPTTLIVKEIGG